MGHAPFAKGISTYIIVITSTCASSFRLRDIHILNFNIDYLGQGHVVDKRDLHHSMANINLYKSCTWAFFASSHRFPDDIYYMISRNCVTLKIFVNVTMYNIRTGAIRWRIPDFIYDGYSNVCSISHHLWDIRQTNGGYSNVCSISHHLWDIRQTNDGYSNACSISHHLWDIRQTNDGYSNVRIHFYQNFSYPAT